MIALPLLAYSLHKSYIKNIKVIHMKDNHSPYQTITPMKYKTHTAWSLLSTYVFYWSQLDFFFISSPLKRKNYKPYTNYVTLVPSTEILTGFMTQLDVKVQYSFYSHLAKLELNGLVHSRCIVYLYTHSCTLRRSRCLNQEKNALLFVSHNRIVIL